MSEPKRCGSCHFGELVAQDITKRLCFGAPPSATQFPMSNGQLSMRMARPIVSVTDKACALHRSKDAADVEQDVNVMRMLQQQQPSTSETKQ